MFRRAFTVEEAKAMLPRVEAVLEGIEEEKAEARRHHDRIGILEAIWGEKVEESQNPDHQEFLELRGALTESLQRIQDIIEREILRRGLRFPQGGLEHGLVDFPTTYEGRWVYLCWQRGEPEVRFWHETSSGYGGRQEITLEQVRRMGKEDDPAALDDSVLDF